MNRHPTRTLLIIAGVLLALDLTLAAQRAVVPLLLIAAVCVFAWLRARHRLPWQRRPGGGCPPQGHGHNWPPSRPTCRQNWPGCGPRTTSCDIDIECRLCGRLMDSNAEFYLLRDRRLVHWRCVLKAGLDPLWIHAAAAS